jgi:hypothetical protein
MSNQQQQYQQQQQQQIPGRLIPITQSLLPLSLANITIKGGASQCFTKKEDKYFSFARHPPPPLPPSSSPPEAPRQKGRAATSSFESLDLPGRAASTSTSSSSSDRSPAAKQYPNTKRSNSAPSHPSLPLSTTAEATSPLVYCAGVFDGHDGPNASVSC